MQEAAPRLLHLLRLSWLLAVANLSLGRAAAAARLVMTGATDRSRSCELTAPVGISVLLLVVVVMAVGW